ncbi:MarR family winged helix-turn-helix transcriptional regulator [Phaeobacter inhibens]|uniref:MarR family winged helix-turn-helix transcriptional regulator n=1 Tax=Phaeobacter inhibens TaxID=221822 RepID=UPI0021A8650C|nr:MarR family transcriptional regulator [Phaeobacter inhibens]UWR44476.1 MarR family transcriptional regulator [Phaeobacter inhibens]
MDHVDFVTQQWERERPDLDVSAMAVIGRVGRLAQAYQKEMQKTWARYDLNAAKFDVLATLRRAGAPYRLSPGDLLQATMVASGTMTNRIDRLVDAGLVARSVNPEDSRSFLIELTSEGLRLINEVVEAHVSTQTRLLDGLGTKEQKLLTELLSKALTSAENA